MEDIVRQGEEVALLFQRDEELTAVIEGDKYLFPTPATPSDMRHEETGTPFRGPGGIQGIFKEYGRPARSLRRKSGNEHPVVLPRFQSLGVIRR